MNQLTVASVNATLNEKRKAEVAHIRGIADNVLFANFRMGHADLMERTQPNLENTPVLVKMHFDGRDNFRILKGPAELGHDTLSFRDLVALDGEDARSVLTVLGNSPLAKTVKAVQHLHRLHPETDVMDLKKAVEAVPDIADQTIDQQIKGIELATRADVAPEPERHPDAPVPKLTPGMR